MPYKPTGKPPGRPSTKPKPVEPEAPKPLGTVQPVPGQERPYDLSPACPVCHPDGWPKDWTGYGCEHGIWARRV